MSLTQISMHKMRLVLTTKPRNLLYPLLQTTTESQSAVTTNHCTSLDRVWQASVDGARTFWTIPFPGSVRWDLEFVRSLYASVVMQWLSYPTETVLPTKITRNIRVLSFRRQSLKTIKTAALNLAIPLHWQFLHMNTGDGGGGRKKRTTT